MDWFSGKKEEFFLILDIGTKAAKALFCFKGNEIGKRLIFLSGVVKKFSEYESASLKPIESLKTAVFDSFKNGKKDILFSTADKRIKNIANSLKKWKTIVTFSPDIFKARVAFKNILRENKDKKITSKEKNKIFESAIESAKEEIFKEFSSKSGIRPKDIRLISSKVLSAKIDGYSVSDVEGYKGKEVEIKIIFTFMPLMYWKTLMEILSVLKKDIKITSIVHLAEAVASSTGIENGLLIDIGGKVTQYFGIKNSQLTNSGEFNFGASNFCELLSSDLGIGSDFAENMQESYSKKLLSKESSAKIKELFSIAKNNWYNELIAEINKKSESAFSPYVYIFGGGGSLPEIQEVFIEKAESSEKNLFISEPFKTCPFLLKDLKSEIYDASKKINDTQWTSSVLIANKYNQ